MKAIGIILTAAGLLGIIFFGLQAIDESESFNLFGLDIAVSSADWTPLIVSAVVTIAGIFVYRMKR